ncbi:MAG: type I methionyl aminopeptidase [Spirochaetota bacterium]
MSVKTSVDILRLAKPAQLLAKLFRGLPSVIRPGITTKQIESFCVSFLEKNNAEVVQQGYRGFPGAVCTSVNNVAAHGIPSDQALDVGDILTVDVSAGIQEWKGDGAWTYVVTSETPDQRRLLRAAWRASLAGVAMCRPGRRIGDVGFAIAQAAKQFGCNVVSEFSGHGIGRSLHEPPSIPATGQAGTGDEIVAGMVLNIEPVVTLGSGRVQLLGDGWSYVTADGALTAQFEHTVAVHHERNEILTVPKELGGLPTDFPPYYLAGN